METFARNFIIASLFYFALMTVAGVIMSLELSWGYQLRFAHVHLGLLGWMSMMIYGVGYHVLPKFTGKPLYSRNLGQLQWVLANLGLIGMVLLAPIKSHIPFYFGLFFAAALVEAIAVFIFVFNLGMTLLRRDILPSVGAGCSPPR